VIGVAIVIVIALSHGDTQPAEEGEATVSSLTNRITSALARAFTNTSSTASRSAGSGAASKTANALPKAEVTNFDGQVGSRSSPLLNRDMSRVLGNGETAINGRIYSGHGLNSMQNAGIYPSIVENTIKYGIPVASSGEGTRRIYDFINDVTVVVDQANGKVVTTFYGK